MPQLDFAFLCDFARVEGGVAHVVAAGVDQVFAPVVPTGQNLGLLIRLEFTSNESNRPHRIEIFMQGEDGGEPLMRVEGIMTPELSPTLPPGWPQGAMFALNFGAPLPAYGIYSFEILVNDESKKSLRLNVLPPPEG